ncbi:MAG: hypothetical protein WBQ24_25345, partial [Xanthobacteraceae bacterium]
MLSIELHHVGAQRVRPLYQSQKLGVEIAVGAAIGRQYQKKPTESRNRHAPGVSMNRDRVAAAIDDRGGDDAAIVFPRWRALRCADFAAERTVGKEIHLVKIEIVSADGRRRGASRGQRGL